MADKYNMVSGAMPAELVSEMREKIAEWKAKMTFLVGLDANERAALVKPNADGVEASGQLAEAAIQNPSYFPVGLSDPAEVLRDVSLVRELEDVNDLLSGFASSVNDTYLAAKSDALRGALMLYPSGLLAARSVPGLDAQIQPLREYFARKGRKSPA
jgi:hypothetical protein